MALFKKSSPDAAATPTAIASPAETGPERGAKKDAPTPKRSQVVREQVRPLVPKDRDQAKREAKARMNEARQKQQRGFLEGDERYLPARDQGVQKRFARDFADSRLSVGELAMPVLFVSVFFLIGFPGQKFTTYVAIGVWVLLIIAVLDAFVAATRARRQVIAVEGASGVVRGFRWYLGMRCMQMRFMRAPKAKVRRGAKVSYRDA